MLAVPRTAELRECFVADADIGAVHRPTLTLDTFLERANASPSMGDELRIAGIDSVEALSLADAPVVGQTIFEHRLEGHAQVLSAKSSIARQPDAGRARGLFVVENEVARLQKTAAVLCAAPTRVATDVLLSPLLCRHAN